MSETPADLPFHDQPDEWSDAITAALPRAETGSWDTYRRALALVSNRKSKSGLVALVNWLLGQVETAEAHLREAHMQAIADDAMVQMHLDDKLSAEAERDRLREALEGDATTAMVDAMRAVPRPARGASWLDEELHLARMWQAAAKVSFAAITSQEPKPSAPVSDTEQEQP